jgi:hypothetical protein
MKGSEVGKILESEEWYNEVRSAHLHPSVFILCVSIFSLRLEFRIAEVS